MADPASAAGPAAPGRSPALRRAIAAAHGLTEGELHWLKLHGLGLIQRHRAGLDAKPFDAAKAAEAQAAAARGRP